jgi:hypothetical protein
MRYTAKNLVEFCWPAGRLGEAIEWLARSGGLISTSAENNQNRHTARLDENNWQQTIDVTAASLGIEVEPVSCIYGKLGEFFQSAAPAGVQMHHCVSMRQPPNSPRLVVNVAFPTSRGVEDDHEDPEYDRAEHFPFKVRGIRGSRNYSVDHV